MKFIKTCFFSAALATLGGMSASVNAGAVVGATEFTQIANQVQLGLSYVRQGLEYKRQGEELVSMVKRLDNMELNTLLDPDKFFEDAYSDMQELGRILQKGENLAYSTGNLESAFRAKHKGFDEWAQLNVDDYNPVLVSDMARDWNQNTKDSVLAALEHTKFQYDDLSDERSAIDALKTQSDTVEGRMQALQAISSIALEQLQHTQKLRSAINNMTTLQANFYAQQAEKEAFQKALAKSRDEDTNAPARNTDVQNGQVLY